MSKCGKPKVFAEGQTVDPEAYDVKVAELREEARNINRSIALHNYEVGDFCLDVLDKAVYGDKGIDALSSDLGISRSQIYACKKYAEAYTRSKAQTFANLGFSWKAIYTLFNAESEERERMEKELVIDSRDPNDVLIEYHRRKAEKLATTKQPLDMRALHRLIMGIKKPILRFKSEVGNPLSLALLHDKRKQMEDLKAEVHGLVDMLEKLETEVDNLPEADQSASGDGEGNATSKTSDAADDRKDVA